MNLQKLGNDRKDMFLLEKERKDLIRWLKSSNVKKSRKSIEMMRKLNPSESKSFFLNTIQNWTKSEDLERIWKLQKNFVRLYFYRRSFLSLAMCWSIQSGFCSAINTLSSFFKMFPSRNSCYFHIQRAIKFWFFSPTFFQLSNIYVFVLWCVKKHDITK